MSSKVPPALSARRAFLLSSSHSTVITEHGWYWKQCLLCGVGHYSSELGGGGEHQMQRTLSTSTVTFTWLHV